MAKVKKAKKEATTESKVYSGGTLVRTYTKKENGAKFKELAEMFAKKNGYEVK